MLAIGSRGADTLFVEDIAGRGQKGLQGEAMRMLARARRVRGGMADLERRKTRAADGAAQRSVGEERRFERQRGM